MSVVDPTVRGTPLIELDHVSRAFKVPGGSITAVDSVSLAIAASEALCIVGESGCGKTTTGRMLAGILRPTSGRLSTKARMCGRRRVTTSRPSARPCSSSIRIRTRR